MTGDNIITTTKGTAPPADAAMSSPPVDRQMTFKSGLEPDSQTTLQTNYSGLGVSARFGEAAVESETNDRGRVSFTVPPQLDPVVINVGKPADDSAEI